MVNYNNGKIYKIEPIGVGEEGNVYIGSTSKPRLCDRMSSHRSAYNKWKQDGKSFYTAFDIFDRYGVDNCHIVLVESVACNTKDELLAREGFYIKSMPCVNKTILTRTRKEYVADYSPEKKQKWLIEYPKQYRETHKDKSSEYNTNYHSREDVKERRRDKEKEKQQSYYDMHKDEIEANKQSQKQATIDCRKATTKRYRDANREKINEKQQVKRSLTNETLSLVTV